MWSQSIRNIKLPAWLKENKSLRLLFTVCGGLLIADLLLYALLVAPAAGVLKAEMARYGEFRKRHADAALFQKQRKELAGLKEGIPSQKDMPLLVKELVQTARRLNLTVSSINYDIPRRSGEELALLSFTFPAEGMYADIKRFVYEVETSDRIVGIQELKLGEEKGRVKAQMKLMTYVRGQ